jgi:hypothetical protein
LLSLRPVVTMLVIISIVLAAGVHAADKEKPSDPYAGWLTYSNEKYGVQFRYPPNLELRILNPDTGSIPTLRLHILLVDKSGGPYDFAVSLMVNEAMNDPMTYVPDKPFLKKVCRKYQERHYNGYEVIRCVTCGSAACSWNIYHLGKYVYHWMCCYNKTGYDEEPTDSKYPVLSIIKSARYDVFKDSAH